MGVKRRGVWPERNPIATIARDFKSERPGKYFAPFGGLIPAAGRLLLAIAEVLLRERGLNFMFCDTDSLCPARPEDMGCEELRKRVSEVIGPDGWSTAVTVW